MKPCTIFSLITLSFVSFSSFANDTAFGSEGTSPMPIQQVNVKMLDEHIIIRGHDFYKNPAKSAWQYRCDYTFKNMSNHTLHFKMGFPLPIYSAEGDVVVSTPAGRKIVKDSPLVYDFTVNINDKSINSKRIKIAPNKEKNLHYKAAYIWDMQFNPDQTVKVQHSYITGVTHDVMGYRWAYYVLRTGGLWQGGTIAHAKLEVIPDIPSRLCNQIPNNDHDYLRPKPKNVEIIGKGRTRKYIWTLSNFTPKEDLSLCIQTGQDYIQRHTVYSVLGIAGDDKITLNKLSLTQLQLLKNTIYAQYGKVFKNPKLQKHFNSEWWYAPNPNYSESLLNKEDKKALRMIANAEKGQQLSVNFYHYSI